MWQTCSVLGPLHLTLNLKNQEISSNIYNDLTELVLSPTYTMSYDMLLLCTCFISLSPLHAQMGQQIDVKKLLSFLITPLSFMALFLLLGL